MPVAPRDDLDFDDVINIDMDRAMRVLRHVFFNETLKPAGLSVQEWRSLLNLARFGETHLRELSRLAGLDPTHTSRATLELERKGYVRRDSDPKVRRRVRLAVTPDGDAMVNHVWAKARALDARVIGVVGEKRYHALREALKMIKEMESLPAEKVFDEADLSS